MAGHKDFKALAVASDVKPGVSPCGMCRQLYVFSLPPLYGPPTDWFFSIREFTTTSFPVYLYGADGEYKVMTMAEVCVID